MRLLLLLLPSLAMAQPIGRVDQGRGQDGGAWNVGNTTTGAALAVRCVNTAGNAFEACGGGGAGAVGLTNAELRAAVVPVSLASTTVTGSVAVTGPLTDAQLRAVAVPVSGTVTANAGTGTLAVSLATAPTTPVTGTFWQATQPVSGTMTCNAGTGTLAVSGPLTDTQLRATAVPVSLTSTTLTGTSTVAISQTTTANDVDVLTLPALPTGANVIGALTANQSTNVAQINGVAPLMGAGATGTGSLRVTVATDSTGYSTANGTIPTQSQLGSARAVAYGSSPAAVTAGNNSPLVADLEGRPYVNTAHPRAFSCQMAAATTATLIELTGCAAVASNSYYITDIHMTGGIANAATVPGLIRSGTGANCSTATATWFTCWHGAAAGCSVSFTSPIKVTTGHAVCAIDATVGTKSVVVNGFIAP